MSTSTESSSPPSTAKDVEAQDHRLSTISKNYDRGQKGYLDDTEKLARALDSGEGAPSIERVIALLENLQSEKRLNMTMKKVIIGLGVFALLLSLANIGTAFAAARLAKDSEADGNRFVNMNGVTLETAAVSYSTNVDGDGSSRRLSAADVSSGSTMTKQQKKSIDDAFDEGALNYVLNHCPNGDGTHKRRTVLTSRTGYHPNNSQFSTAYSTNVAISCSGNSCDVTNLHACDETPCTKCGNWNFCSGDAPFCSECGDCLATAPDPNEPIFCTASCGGDVIDTIPSRGRN